MADLNQYDAGAVHYLNTLGLNKMPLMSWDFYGNYLQELNYNAADLKELSDMASANKWVWTVDKNETLEEQSVIVVTNPQLTIVFASKNIVKMTGYQSAEIIGKKPTFFQGEATSEKTKAEIRDAIIQRKPFDKIVVNYKKNGESYQCHIKAFPIFTQKGQLSHFIAFEKAA